MRQILLRAVVLLGSWAIGLLVAAWVVPGGAGDPVAVDLEVAP
jgi:hypothetical protein